MAKPTPPTSYLTSDGSRIYEAPFFLYEVVTYKLYNTKQANPSKGRAELINSKFFKASKPLATLSRKVLKKPDYLLEQSIVWIGAPMSYITDNNLTIYDPKKKKNEKGRSNVQKRKLR
jgi:hypothetical protein